jgi:DNA-binding LytR/AlgR family response regulator
VLLPNDYYVVIPITSIVRVKWQSNECSFLLNEGDYFSALVPLPIIAEDFSDYQFIRIHPNHLINLNYLKSFVQCDAFVTLTNTDSIPVSSENSERIIEFLTKQNII